MLQERVDTRTQRGFSILELLIAVGIIIIVAAIVIPNLLRARAAANESSAVGSPAGNRRRPNWLPSGLSGHLGTYACQFSYLGPPLGSAPVNSTAADLIDMNLASGTKSGYDFTMDCTPSGRDGSNRAMKSRPHRSASSTTDATCGTDAGAASTPTTTVESTC